MTITIIRKPRDGPIPDIAIGFPPLENLHLEFLENKKKLKKGLPLIPIGARKIKSAPVVVPADVSKTPSSPKPIKTKPVIEEDDEDLKDLEDSDDDISLNNDKDEEEMLGELGDEEDKDEDLKDENVPEEEEEEDPCAGMTPEEREEYEREELLWDFRKLKKKYKTSAVPIPEYNEHTDVETMRKSYKRVVREISLDGSVESYRTYLMAGFMGMEFACTQFLQIDMGGFTKQQVMMMNKYDSLLVELGEKNSVGMFSTMPVEIRIIGLIVLQAGIFYLGKIISENYGGTIADLFRGFTGQPPPQKQKEPEGEEEPKKKKMRGPKVKSEDIKKNME